MQLVTPVGDTAYVWLTKPQPAMQEGKEPQYSMTLLWDKDNPKLAKLKAAILSIAEAKWGKKAGQMLEKGQLKNPLRDGDEDRSDNAEFAGKVFLTARSSDKPEVVDTDAEPIMHSIDIYSGMKARADIYLFAFDKAGNKGVSAILNSVQKLGDGERKSGRRSAKDAFGDEEDDGADDGGNLL